METTGKIEKILPLLNQPCPCGGGANGYPDRCGADCDPCPLTLPGREHGGLPFNAIRFNSTEYEFNHGRAPRNPSDGGTAPWAFGIRGRTYFLNGKLAACKRTALAIAREVGALEVKILP